MFTHPIAIIKKYENLCIKEIIVCPRSRWLHGHAIFELCNWKSSRKQKILRNRFCLFIWGLGWIFIAQKSRDKVIFVNSVAVWTRIKKFSTALKSDYLCWFWGLIYCRIGPNPNICIYRSVYSNTLNSLGILTGQNYFLVLMRRRMLIVYDSSPMLYT